MRAKASQHRAANLDRPSYQWSQRDWWIFHAHCGQTERRRELARRVVTAVRSGTSVKEVAEQEGHSRSYIHQILAAEDLRDRIILERFYAKRKNLGRPIDMGGPRDRWIEE